MFVHRGPTASSGLGPGRPHELRVDYQIADQEGICPREPLRQREGSPGAHAQAKEGPRGLVCWLFCLTDVFSFHMPLWRWLRGFSPTAA